MAAHENHLRTIKIQIPKSTQANHHNLCVCMGRGGRNPVTFIFKEVSDWTTLSLPVQQKNKSELYIHTGIYV